MSNRFYIPGPCDRTWVEPEERCYPTGAQLRKGRAICPDGKIRTVRAGIPDTFFTIPASTRINGRYTAGFLTMDDGVWTFRGEN